MLFGAFKHGFESAVVYPSSFSMSGCEQSVDEAVAALELSSGGSSITNSTTSSSGVVHRPEGASSSWFAHVAARRLLTHISQPNAAALVVAFCSDSGGTRGGSGLCAPVVGRPSAAAAASAPLDSDDAVAQSLRSWARDDAAYLVAFDRGLLQLAPATLDTLGVAPSTIVIEADGPCLGSSAPVRWLLAHAVGYDTAIINAVLAATGGRGFVRAEDRSDVYVLSHATEVAQFSQGLGALLLFKLGTACGAVFLLFASSSLVSFILGHTQQRMLQFTVALNYNVRNRMPLVPLVVTHLLGSLVFVPIMLGVLFFLFEFFADQLLAFLVLLLVWISEVWNIATCRTLGSLVVFPRVYGVSVTVFHIYYLLYPFGYQYLSLLSTFLVIVCCAFYLWNRYELPALLRGDIGAAEPRAPELVYVMGGQLRLLQPGPRVALSISAPAAGEGSGSTPQMMPSSDSSTPGVGSAGLAGSPRVRFQLGVPVSPLPPPSGSGSMSSSRGVASPLGGRRSHANSSGAGRQQQQGDDDAMSVVQPQSPSHAHLSSPARWSLDATPPRPVALGDNHQHSSAASAAASAGCGPDSIRMTGREDSNTLLPPNGGVRPIATTPQRSRAATMENEADSPLLVAVSALQPLANGLGRISDMLRRRLPLPFDGDGDSDDDDGGSISERRVGEEWDDGDATATSPGAAASTAAGGAATAAIAPYPSSVRRRSGRAFR